MIDIDKFKSVNDTYGHECGDLVLVSIARQLEVTLRQQDIVTRWGGEEFIILLPESDQAGALSVAEKIRSAINQTQHIYGDTSLSVTATLGVCVHNKNHPIDDTIHRADKALYRGKKSGRNCVVEAGSLDELGEK